MKKPHLIGALSAIVFGFISLSSYAAPVSGQGTWESTLQGRDLDGDLTTAEAYYDTILGITWLADVNYAGTAMDWDTANSWAAGLNIDGYTNWRLPDTIPINGISFDYTYAKDGSTDVGYNVTGPWSVSEAMIASEMTYMSYNTLGNLAYFDVSGAGPQTNWGLSNTGPFSSLIPCNCNYRFWSATDSANDPSFGDVAFYFDFGIGYQGDGATKNVAMNAWAVHDGDIGVAVVPVPPALWLFGSGLLGLVGVTRRKRTA